MALDALLFVSKRLQLVAAALICLAVVQLGMAVCSPQPAPTATWRVAISPQH